MTTDGVELQVGPRRQPLRATPSARTIADMWLLGSSDYSARLAAEKGLPYVFAHHFSGEGTGAALDLYRSSYRPSPEYPEPRTFLTVNAVVAETEEEARRRALPNVQQMIALRTGAPAPPAAARRGGRGRRDDRRPARLRRRDGAALDRRLARPGADRSRSSPRARRRRGDGAPRGGRRAGTDVPPHPRARRRCGCSRGVVAFLEADGLAEVVDRLPQPGVVGGAGPSARRAPRRGR